MTNKLTVSGMIVAVRQTNDKKRGSVTVAVKSAYRVRKDGKGENEVRDDYVVLNFNESTGFGDLASRFKTGSHVKAVAHAASFIRNDEKNNTRIEIVNFYLDSIEPLETEFTKTFGVQGGHYPADELCLCVEGTIEGMTIIGSTGVSVRINIAEKNGRRNYINAAAFGPVAKLVKQSAIGDQICASMQLRTAVGDERRADRDFNSFRITGFANANASAQPAKSKKKHNDAAEQTVVSAQTEKTPVAEPVPVYPTEDRVEMPEEAPEEVKAEPVVAGSSFSPFDEEEEVDVAAETAKTVEANEDAESTEAESAEETVEAPVVAEEA